MERNLSLDREMEEIRSDENRGALGKLEERVEELLVKYREMKKENDTLSGALDQEREKRRRLEKSLETLSEDKEQVKVRIDQLLQRLKGIDL